MVEQEPKAEFARAGLDVTTHKIWRDTRNTVQLARRTARETRITMALAAIAIALLLCAIYMLWRVLEHLR
jgi:hypothetical protein